MILPIHAAAIVAENPELEEVLREYPDFAEEICELKQGRKPNLDPAMIQQLQEAIDDRIPW